MTDFGKRKRTKIGFWNVRTMLEASKFAQIVREFQNYKLEILGLSEIRWSDSGETKAASGETLIYSCKPATENRRSGVGFLISPQTRKGLMEWTPVSDRIITARFKTFARNITIVQTYAPTNQATTEEKEEFYLQLSTTLDKIRKGDIKIVMGDLNAKVGSNNSNFEHVMGRHGLGEMNENGELFTDLCSNHDLVIGGTIFPHKQIHKETWCSPDGRTANQIDHLAISRKWRRSLLNVRSYRGADVYSDHHLVIGTIQLKVAKIKDKSTIIKRTVDPKKLKNPHNYSKFRSKLHELLPSSTALVENSEVKWNKVLNAYKEAGEQYLAREKEARSEWISDKTWEFIKERKEQKSKVNSVTDKEKLQLMNSYHSLGKKVKKSARADRRKWMENLADQAQKASASGNVGETYRLAKQMSTRKFNVNRPLRDKLGNLISSEGAQMNRWTEHFHSVLNHQNTVQQSDSILFKAPKINPSKFNTIKPNATELKEAIKHLKSGKATGPDNLSPELLTADIESAVDHLLPIIQDIWSMEIIPAKWKEGLIVKIPKKGDLSDCGNWRGITLLNTVNKILAFIISTRLSEVLDPAFRKEQAGFRPGRSCTNQINTLRIIIEQSAEFQSPLYLLFIDFEKAFDSVNREFMWKVLDLYGVPGKLLNLVKELYRDCECKVIHCGKTGDGIPLQQGVRQGCILSSLLFITVLDCIMLTVNAKPRGIKWTMHSWLEDLDFADDICLLSHKMSDMIEKTNHLIELSKIAGMKINVSKTKLMKIGNSKETLQIYGTNVEEVNIFQYLGSQITKDGGAQTDVTCRIKKARQAFGMLNNIWKSSQISRSLKLKIYKSNVKSVLLYGCETWKTTNKIINDLQVFQNKCLRRILKIWWPNKISNESLWRITEMPKIEYEICRRKWGWIGHVLRMEVSEIPRHAMDWNPPGNRKAGRPKTTWRRTILEEAKTQKMEWKEVKTLARNRVRWRLFVDALCSSMELKEHK